MHAGGPTGTVQPSSFILHGPYPQRVEVAYTAPDASGLVRQVATFSTGHVDVDINNVMIQGLVELTAGIGITLTGSKDRHPENHFGTPTMIQQLRELARIFHDKFDKNIVVNDISLPRGGLFDIDTNNFWNTPHKTHRLGKNADLNYEEQTETERTFFESKAEGLGFKVEKHPNNRKGTRRHWHITLR